MSVGQACRRPGGLDLAVVLAQLGLDERQVEEGVRLLLGRERPQLGVGAGQRLAVLADPLEAVLATGSSRGRGRSPGAGRCAPSSP